LSLESLENVCIEKELELEKELLTKQQIENLNETFPKIDYEFYLEKIKSYGKEKNKVYEDFYITIMNWARRDITKNGGYDKVIIKKDNSLKTKEDDWSKTDWT
jgi:enolase